MVANCYNWLTSTSCNNLQPLFVCCVKTAQFNKKKSWKWLIDAGLLAQETVLRL